MTNLTLDGNVFDHNGWTDAAYSSLGCNPSIYNHDAYLNVHNDNVRRHRQRLRQRRQPRAAGAGGRGRRQQPVPEQPDRHELRAGERGGEGRRGDRKVAGNTIVGSRNIDANNPRGWGLEIGNTKPLANGGGVVVKNNVYTTYGGAASGDPGHRRVQRGQPHAGSRDQRPEIQNNVVYGWTKGITTNGGLVDGATGRNGVNGLVVRNNDFEQTLLTPVVEHNNNYSASGETWSNNRYNSVKTDTGSQQYFNLGSTYTYLSGWKSSIEPTATEVKVGYPDPSRTASTYDKSLGGTGTTTASWPRNGGSRRRSGVPRTPRRRHRLRQGRSSGTDRLRRPPPPPRRPRWTVGGGSTYSFSVTYTDDNRSTPARSATATCW